MLQGAIIGLIVGLISVMYMAYKQKRGGKAVLAALESGTGARDALDKYVAPVHGKVPQRRFIDLLERFSWLAILGEYDTLEREAASLEGNISFVTQLRVQAALGLLAHRTEARDLEALRSQVAHFDAEGGALMGLVKKQMNDVATLAGGLQQMPVPPEVVQKVHKRAKQSGKAARIVLFRFLARVAETAGGDPTPFRRDAEVALAALKG